MDPPSPAFFVASLPPRRNALTRWLSVVALAVAATYPFFKSFFAVPQAYLGIAFGSAGDLDAAIEQFNQALAITPASSEARRNLQMAVEARRPPAGARP